MKGHYTNSICGVGLPSTQSNKKPNEYIDITIGVFFNGTGNNKYNIEYNKGTKYADRKGVYNGEKQKKEEGYDSYNQEFTNVVHLWNIYNAYNPYMIKLYVEGPGTAPPKENKQAKSSDKWISSGKKDDNEGLAFGTGHYGVDNRVTRTYIYIVEEIKTILSKKRNPNVRSITFDVFGFSRGATASRIFVQQTLDPNSLSYLKVYLQRVLDLNISKKVSIRFMGLFDTVSSVGIDVAYDPSKQINLMIPNNVKTVIHLVAANEYRRYFPLTTVSSAHHLGKSCMEYVLPGAHSDIGGGYAKEEHEPLYMGFMPSGFELTYRPVFRGYMTFKQLYNGKWISDELYNYASDQYWRRNHFKEYNRKYPPYRRVCNEYARISLQIMYQVAKEKSVPLETAIISKKYLLIPDKYQNLIKVAKYLKGEFFARRDIYVIRKGNTKDKNGKKVPMGIDFVRDINVDKLLKSVRREFLHLSAYNETGFGATSNNRRGIIEG